MKVHSKGPLTNEEEPERSKFKSKDKQLHGELYLDEKGRLIRYKQGKLVIQLEE